MANIELSSALPWLWLEMESLIVGDLIPDLKDLFVKWGVETYLESSAVQCGWWETGKQEKISKL